VDPADTITRGEAARAICRLVGKEANNETLVSFNDVSSSHPYAADIALVATALTVKETTYTVAPGESIQDAIDQAKSFAGNDYARVTIELEGGTHTLTETVVLTNDSYDVGKLELIIKNVDDEKPVVSGNVDIPASSFTQVEGKEYYSYQLPNSAMVSGSWPSFRNLYLNGQYLNIAATEMRVFEESLRNTVNTGTSAQWTYDNWFYLDETDFNGVSQSNVVPMELCINVEWMTKIFRIATFSGFDTSSGLAQVSVASDDWTTFMNNDGNKRDFKGWSYWLQNHISFLDEPGEFFYDPSAGKIYVYPYDDTNMSTATVSYSTVETLFKLEEASNVTFEGITFTGTTSTYLNNNGFNGGLGGIHMGTNSLTGDRGHIPHGAIIGAYTINLRVLGCTFDALGGHGIFLDHGNRNLTVKGNSFTDLAMSGITVGRLYPMWNEYSGLINLVIDNNYIHNIGIDFPLCSGVQVSRVLNAAITNNTITHTPYCGIMANWLQSPSDAMNSRNVEIAYNYLEDNVYATNDGAPIYLPGANADIDETELFMYCHHNYLKATGYNKTYNGIYLDANASNWLVEYNVVDGFKTNMGPIFNQGTLIVDQKTYNNTVRNNYTTLERVFVKEWSTFYYTTVTHRNIVLENNQFYESSSDLPAAARTIIADAGQKAAYADVIPVKDTVIDMTTSDAHVTLKQNGNPDTVYVTFTITNNGDLAANYRVIGANDISNAARVVVSTRCLTLQPGETGTIEVSFRGSTTQGANAIADFVVMKDNGWKREYRRVINLTVGSTVESNPVLSEDELLGEPDELLPPGGDSSDTDSDFIISGEIVPVVFEKHGPGNLTIDTNGVVSTTMMAGNNNTLWGAVESTESVNVAGGFTLSITDVAWDSMENTAIAIVVGDVGSNTGRTWLTTKEAVTLIVRKDGTVTFWDVAQGNYFGSPTTFNGTAISGNFTSFTYSLIPNADRTAYTFYINETAIAVYDATNTASWPGMLNRLSTMYFGLGVVDGDNVETGCVPGSISYKVASLTVG